MSSSQQLPGDLSEHVVLQHVLPLLAPRGLLKVAAVNRTCERLAGDDLLWEPLLRRLWKDFDPTQTGRSAAGSGAMVPWYRVRLTAQGWGRCRMRELKAVIKRRKLTQKTRKCLEKSEFVKIITESDPLCIGNAQFVRSFGAKWKASFWTSLRDGKRNASDCTVRREDISTYKWRMTFHQAPNAAPWVSTFHADGSLSSVPENHSNPNVRWELTLVGGTQFVAVHPYPQLHIERADTELGRFGWVMWNQYVRFVRTDQPV